MGIRRWTHSAIECYLRGCVCDGCFYKEFFEEQPMQPHKCQMKFAVIELVRVLGTPENVQTQTIVED